MASKQSGEAAARRFYTTVKKHLECPRKLRRDVLLRLRSDLADYLHEHPEADDRELTAQMGEPVEFARSYIASLEPAELEAAIKKAKFIKRTVIALCCVALLLLILTFVKMIYDNQHEVILYEVESISY